MSKLCPSAPCEAGALMFGRVGDDGAVHFLDRPIEVDADAAVALGGPDGANERLRFTAPCQAERCANWSKRCGVPDMVAKLALEHGAIGSAAVDCPIRSRCRWYDQEGLSACRLCPTMARPGLIVRPGEN